MRKHTYIAIAAGLILAALNATAQVDRSKAPSAAPAPKVNIGDYESFELENGLKVFVVENHKIPRVSFQLRLDLDPMKEKDKAGYISMAGQLMRRGTTTRTKAKLDDEVDFMGASLSTSADGIFASSLKKHTDKLLDLMTDVLYNASMPEEELEKIKKQTKSGLEAAKDSPDEISQNVASVLRFGKDHPYGELVTEETVDNITIDDCRAYVKKFFKPNMAYLAIVGDITAKDAKALVRKYFGQWEQGAEHSFRHMPPDFPEETRVCVVDKAGAVQSAISVTYPINFRPGAPDAVKARVMNTILGGSGFSGRLMQNLREDKAYTYGSYSSLISDEEMGYFSAFAKVRNEVTDSAVHEILREMNRIRDEKVDEKTLTRTKNKIAGSFARSLERPQTIANFALNIAIYNLPKDYYQTYLERLSTVSAEDVQAMAKKYITPDEAYILIVGNRDEVKDKVKRFNPNGKVELYDMYGEPAAEIKKAPEGTTAQTVINNFLMAKTGQSSVKKATKKLSKVQDETVVMKGSVRMMELTVKMFRKAPNMFAQTIGNAEMTMQEQVFDGTKGVARGMQGAKAVEGESLVALKWASVMHVEMKYEELGFTIDLKGIETIDDKDYYKIEVTDPTGDKSTEYYDVETNLKSRSITTRKTDRGEFTSTIDYSDYKEVDGLMYPHKMKQNLGFQVIDLTVTEVQVNTGLKASVFDTEIEGEE